MSTPLLPLIPSHEQKGAVSQPFTCWIPYWFGSCRGASGGLSIRKPVPCLVGGIGSVPLLSCLVQLIRPGTFRPGMIFDISWCLDPSNAIPPSPYRVGSQLASWDESHNISMREYAT